MKKSFFIKHPDNLPDQESPTDMQISSIEQVLTEVKNFIYNNILPSHEEIDQELVKLEELENLFKNPPKDLMTSSFLEKQKDLSLKLAKQCADLHTRKKVITFAEQGESFVHKTSHLSDEDLWQKAYKLEESIESFVSTERLSIEDAKFIRFANICIHKAKNREPLVHPLNAQNVQKITQLCFLSQKEPTQNSYLLGEELYASAHSLYKDDYEAFYKSINDLSPDVYNEIIFHIEKCEGSIENISTEENKLSCIQGILGYAHHITDYYLSHEPYPTFVEIHKIFQDLELIEIENDLF